MAIRPILRVPAPELRRVCAPVERPSAELSALVTDLIDTLESIPGCVGIAASQVGDRNRVIVVDASRHRKPVENQGRMVLINPELRSSSGRQVGREGCLSLPDYTANVPRAQLVEYAALDEALSPRTVVARDFEAVVLQHETDHLDGILFVDRVVCLKTDLFRRKNYL